MRQAVNAVLVMVVLIGAIGCEASGGKHRHAAAPEQVEHVVLFWLKTPGDQAAVRKIMETSRTFESIPGVLAVRTGGPVASTRPVVDDSFDVALVVTFTDVAALQAYETHPTHADAVRDVLRPLVGKIVVYDISESGGGNKEAGAAPAPASH